jgi:tetratricopeptide (TPR) repeat protein
LMERSVASSGKRGAVLMLLDGLQDADDASLSVIQQLLADASTAPVFCVASVRSEALDTLPIQWSGQRRLALAPLHDAPAAALAAALLQPCVQVSPWLPQLLIKRAAGNPFYMQELLGMWMDEGVVREDSAAGAVTWHVDAHAPSAAHLPATLVAVLQARLDALPAVLRRALQQASVVGAVFWAQALALLDEQAPAALPELLRRGLLKASPEILISGVGAWAFQHDLLHQVAYEMVLKSARRQGHAQVAAWLKEKLSAQGGGSASASASQPAAGSASASAFELLVLLAHHEEQAGEPAQALLHLEQAARDAHERFALREAQALHARALASPGLTDPRQHIRWLRLRSSAADVLGDRALQEQAMQQRLALAQGMGDGLEAQALQAAGILSLALLAGRRGDDEKSVSMGRQAMTLAEQVAHKLGPLPADFAQAPAAVASLANGHLAWCLFKQAQLEEAGRLARAALHWGRIAAAEASRPDDHVYEVQALTTLGHIETALGRWTQARQVVVEALALARQRHLRRDQMQSLFALAGVESGCGCLNAAQACFEQALLLARAIGARAYEAAALLGLASLSLDLGQTEQALGQGDEALVAYAAVQDAYNQANTELLLARAQRLLGDAAAASQRVQSVLTAAQSQAWAPLVAAASAEQSVQGLLAGHADGALQALTPGLDLLLAATPLPDLPDPLLASLQTHQVLAALGDARAGPLISTLHQRLLEQASHMPDDTARQRFLVGPATHRAIVAAAVAWTAKA